MKDPYILIAAGQTLFFKFEYFFIMDSELCVFEDM